MIKSVLTFLLILSTTFLFAQSEAQKKLEQRKEQLLEEIKMNERILQENRSKEKSVVNVIQQQKAKIELREKLIQTNEKQAKLLNDDIYTNQLKINKLKRELEVLKEDYANMIVKSYKSRSERSRAMFLLSSKDFTQAYKRVQYMKQYAGYRKSQGDDIKVKSTELEAYNVKLGALKSEKEKIIQEQEKEKLVLVKEKQEQEKLVKSIKKDQKKIVADIKKKQQEAKDIDKKIQKAIRDAIAAENKKTAKKGGTKTASTGTSSSKIVLTAEGKIESDNFKSNKGKLPWPVEKGFVSLKFGNQPHPVQPSLTIHSNGVEITTESGSSARSVFAGEVMLIQVLSPINKAVYIKHGDFITVYQNLSTVSVNKGDKVGIKQAIGRIRTNESSGKTAIKFSVLQNDSFLNPQSWLYNM
ncbi:MAG TPA: peptidoglycan DD-metalloendopeptidase family protein [Flavobacterium sp.]|uniref:murein hydrolase activator EnvC family protein n=1 Tax=unclassified Flavobacterium TaxID=196869 RepID=UPI000E896B06|nr:MULTISPECIES: peptidoglycan DD-metalloendopeptidase family protein [unclassified Flavobacterium]HBI01035.1 peptidase M23 [Flavobacterium sp.]HRE77795.1 peptidoglycan DD-metalloendopeptidase family protein [Flavobacterium sp.]